MSPHCYLLKNSQCRYALPCRVTLGGSILDRNYEADIAENKRLLALPGIEKFGLAVTTDGATIQRHALMNVMALSVVFSSVLLLGVLDASEHLAKGLHKDAEYIANSIIPIIRQLPNPLCLDLVVCDGAADMTRFRALLCAVFPFVLSVWCNSRPSSLKLQQFATSKADLASAPQCAAVPSAVLRN